MAVEEREKARWAASALGRPEVAVAMRARMWALMEVLLGVVVVWVVSRSGGRVRGHRSRWLLWCVM